MTDDLPTFAELDELCDRALPLGDKDLNRLIAAMRAYRANAMGKGKATKFSDEAKQPTVDMKALLKSLNVAAPTTKTIRRRL